MDLSQTEPFDIRKEAAWALSNATTCNIFTTVEKKFII